MALLPVLPLALALAGPGAAASPQRTSVPPRPARYATDRTGRLPAARIASLNEKLASFERETSTQVMVYVDSRVPADTTLEEFANTAFREWRIGQKGKDNGVLFLAFLDDRVMRIEVGYGLEGAIPDARAHQITSDFVKPLFRTGDYAGGVEAAADQIIKAARGEPYQGSGRTVAETSRGGLTPFGFVLYALFAVPMTGGVGYLLYRSWRNSRTSPPLARWARRLASALWSVFALLMLLGPVTGFPSGRVVLALIEAALACRLAAALGEKKGFDLVRGLAGPLGLMIGVALAPRVFSGIATGLLDMRELYAMGGSLFIGVLASVRGVGSLGSGSSGRRVSWSSGSTASDSSWSSSSSSSSDSSWSSSSSSDSSSSFSGGGGDSGGGGSSDSW